MSRLRFILSVVLGLLSIAAPAAATHGPAHSPSPSPASTDSPSPNPPGSPAPPSPSPAGSQTSSAPSPAASAAKTGAAGPSAPTVAPKPEANPVLGRVNALKPGGKSFSGPPRERVQDVLDGINARLARLTAEMQQVMLRTGNIRAELARAQARAAAAGSEFRKSRIELNERAGSFYMAGTWQDTLAIMVAGDLESAAQARVYIQSIMGADFSVVERLRDARLRLARAQAVVEARSRTLAGELSSVERQRARLDATRRELERVLGEAVRTFSAGSSAIRSLIDAAQRGQAPAPPEERFIYRPVFGPISSPYGMRTHPVWKYRSFHTGLDLSARAGTPITAPRDGVVLESGLAGPFGLATVIDHGSRIASMVAHQSATLVQPGSRVKAGQIIGFVGCTGWCTGPHVHLEVWFMGRPNDPMAWLVTTKRPSQPQAPLRVSRPRAAA